MTRGARANLIALSSALTLGALGWQSHLMDEQNDYNAEQAHHLKEQVSLERSSLHRQSTDSTNARRLELLSLIYDRVTCAEKDLERLCPPKASARARQEAVVEFLELERKRGVLRPDLSRAPLAGLEFISEDFRNAELDEADLSGAALSSADFSGADLSEATLADAKMVGANFQDADMLFSDLSRGFLWSAKFNRTDLSGAVLAEAKLIGVELGKAILDGADLSNSRGLDQAELDQSFGNSLTRLPKGLTAPSTWSTRKSPRSKTGEQLLYTARKLGRAAERLAERH